MYNCTYISSLSQPELAGQADLAVKCSKKEWHPGLPN